MTLPRLRSSLSARSVNLPTLVGTVVVAAAALVALPATASTPAGGSVSDTSTTTSWSGGPFVVANVTATAGEVQCGTATPCDDYQLTVSTPAGYGTDHQLKIKVSWPNPAADFDVYVYDATGASVGSAASSSDPEVLLLPPNSGTYTVRVVPFAPLGESYTATATLTTNPTNPPPSTETAPTYRNSTVPEGTYRAHDAGEPSIGVNWKTGNAMYQSYNATYRVSYDSAGNATWLDKSARPTACTAATSLDPILFTDSRLGRTFESQLAGKASLTCFTDNDGDTWTPSQGSGINSGVDHQTIGGGPFSSASTVGAVTSYPNAVYYCSQDIADALCAVSHDGGLTFGAAVPIYTLLECGGLHGHVKVAPDGTVYTPNKGCGGNQAVAVSEDSGTTWTVRKNPFSTAGHSDPSVGIGANGTVYMGYQNSDGTPRVAVTRDKGKTWTDDQNVGAALGIKNIVFPAVVAGDDDRASFAFLGSTTGGDYQDQANFHGEWHLYVATTYDGGKSWVTADATPTDPVQRGSICTGGTTCGDDRNLLDFMDVTIDKAGRVLVGYADGCTTYDFATKKQTATCPTGGPQNYDSLATIARQSSGKGLFAAYDQKPDLTVSNVTATKGSRSSVVLTAKVSNIGNAPAAGVVTQFLDGSTVVGTTSGISLNAGATATVSFTYKPNNATGSHTYTAVVDPLNAIAESNEGNNKSQSSVVFK